LSVLLAFLLASRCIATSFSPEPNEPNCCHSPVAISWHVRYLVAHHRCSP
jgi:hypothetical protein